MNNQDFRRLVGDTPRQQHGNSSPATSKTPNVSLGSRQKSSIPMTPRTVGGTNNSSSFARQLAEQRNETQSARKFKAMAAPRGVKLAKGYQDRASARAATNEDEREERIRALEEQMKLGQIEKSAFVQMRDEITGGDVGATHLVKGLDMKLLERVRKGEDVFAPNRPAHGDSVPSEEEKMGDDAELDQLEQKEVTAVEREKIHKKGEMAPPPLAPSVAGVKRSRNDILAELKAHRQAASEAKAASAAQPRSNFKRFGEQKQASSRIERDEKGREVLITVDENGRVKRKVRKVAATAEQPKRAMPMPDPKVKPLGMEAPQLPLPAPASTPIEDEDDDIFEGVGDSYDPLGAVEDSDGSDSDADDDTEANPRPEKKQETSKQDEDKAPTAPQPPVKHNYFNDAPSTAETSDKTAPFQDPTILAALKRAAALKTKDTDLAEDGRNGKKDKPSTAAERLLQRDRDYDDLDMGFGGSRGDDDDDGGDDGKIKLSEWKGAGAGHDDDDDDEGGKGGKQRKRGKKKRKGDKNSAADIMKVIEARR